MYFWPPFIEFQYDSQREIYDDFPKSPISDEIWEPKKKPNFHRSYLRKYCEPRSKIVTRSSSGFRFHVIKISASKPS